MNIANSWSISVEDLLLSDQGNYWQQPLPAEIGSGQSNLFKIDEDLSVIETHYTPSKKLAILSRIENIEPRVVVTLCLKGYSLFSDRQGTEIVFAEGYTAITTFNSSIGDRLYEADKAVLQLRFSVTKSWLERYFGEEKFASLFSQGTIQTISHHPTSPTSLFAAQQLLTKNGIQATQKILAHAQALTILAAELGRLCKDTAGRVSLKNPKDKRIAISAREILFNEFKNPPSITDLASRAGTNPYKLKQLFHQFFNNTPYGMLLEIRMQHAYHLLKSGYCHVGVVADAVGYNHPSNFSAAFTKYYGITPKQLAKS